MKMKWCVHLDCTQACMQIACWKGRIDSTHLWSNLRWVNSSQLQGVQWSDNRTLVNIWYWLTRSVPTPSYLEPQATIFSWMFSETPIFHVNIWNHLIETTIFHSWILFWYQVVVLRGREVPVFFFEMFTNFSTCEPPRAPGWQPPWCHSWRCMAARVFFDILKISKYQNWVIFQYDFTPFKSSFYWLGQSIFDYIHLEKSSCRILQLQASHVFFNFEIFRSSLLQQGPSNRQSGVLPLVVPVAPFHQLKHDEMRGWICLVLQCWVIFVSWLNHKISVDKKVCWNVQPVFFLKGIRMSVLQWKFLATSETAPLHQAL